MPCDESELVLFYTGKDSLGPPGWGHSRLSSPVNAKLHPWFMCTAQARLKHMHQFYGAYKRKRLIEWINEAIYWCSLKVVS